MQSNVEETEQGNLKVMLAMGEAFNRKDLNAIMDLFAEDAAYEDYVGAAPSGNRYEGRTAIRQVFASQFAATPNYRFADYIPLVQDKYGALEYSIVIPGPVEIRAKLCDFFEFSGGKVVRKSTWMKHGIR